MARSSADSSPSLHFLFLVSSLLFASNFHASKAVLAINESVPLMPPESVGLSFDFHQQICPELEPLVREFVDQVLRQDIGQAPGLLRIFFHDCWVQGCDASILLDGGERNQPVNIGIRPEALNTIEILRNIIHARCGRTVSCADITVLAAREAVSLTGGPLIPVSLGRPDSLSFDAAGTNQLPGPSSTTSDLLNNFLSRGVFDVGDVVALSGAHTFGIAHCPSFFNDLINRLNRQFPPMDSNLANSVLGFCPSAQSPNAVVLDPLTPAVFDNSYFVGLLNGRGLFTSDQDLFSDPRTSSIVAAFALDQQLFFQRFAVAFQKMSLLSSGLGGNIRARCNLVGVSDNLNLTPLIDDRGSAMD